MLGSVPRRRGSAWRESRGVRVAPDWQPLEMVIQSLVYEGPGSLAASVPLPPRPCAICSGERASHSCRGENIPQRGKRGNERRNPLTEA